jgi:AcrR family transcriptional regulator
MRTVNGASTRHELLDAAMRIVLRDGPNRLTLDAVAKESGRSKGGVLYHFPTKDALIEGMIGDYLEDFAARIARHEATDDDLPPGRLLRAYVNASFDEDPLDWNVGVGMLAAIAANPALLDPVREHDRIWRARLAADGLDPAVAEVVRLAVDGLAFADFFGSGQPPEPLREEIRRALLAMAGGSPARAVDPAP